MTKKNRKFVVVRTFSAGVHAGYLVSRKGKEVVLADCMRIWSWRGANTLNEVARDGVGSGSRVSVAVTENTLTEAIEVIAASDACHASLLKAGWAA